MIKFLQHKNLAISAFMTGLVLRSSSAFAQDCSGESSNLADVTLEMRCEVSNLPSLFSAAAYIMGIGFVIAGLLKMKEFVDDPQRSFMKDALIRLGVGAMLISLPFAIYISAKSLGAPNSGADFGRSDLYVFDEPE